MPKVSIIIPTYNRAHLLPRAIKSVLNQTFKDFELIIVDDGSTDDTKDVVQSFQRNDSRIRYIHIEHSGGYPSKVINVGIKNSLGSFITFCASDDEWDKKYLEKQIPLLEKDNGIDIVASNVVLINNKNEIVKEIWKPQNKENDFILRTSFIKNYIFGNLIFRKNIFEKVGLYDEKIKIREDFDMWIRLVKDGYNFQFVYEPLYIIHLHSNQISSSTNRLEIIKIENYLFRKYRNIYDKYLKAKSIYFRHISTHYALLNNRNLALKNILIAIKCAPFHLRNYINLFLLLIDLRFFKLIFKLKTKLLQFSF